MLARGLRLPLSHTTGRLSLLRVSTTWCLCQTGDDDLFSGEPVTMSLRTPNADALPLTRLNSVGIAVCIPRPSQVSTGASGEVAWPIRMPLASRLSPREWRRRLIHMSPGLLPGLLLAIPHPDPLAWYSQAAIIAVVAGMSVFALRGAQLFERQDETGWAISVVSYAVIILTMLLAFPAQPEMGLVVTVIIAFGDGSATLGGLLAQGPRLPWNMDKSWVGFSAFLLISIPLAALVYWGEARPGVSLSTALAFVVPACMAAAVAESLPMRLNDNIRVGVIASLTMIVTRNIFVW